MSAAVAPQTRPQSTPVPSAPPAAAPSRPESGRLSVRLGDSTVPVVFVRNGPGNVLLNLHQDEVTSRRVGEAHVRRVGGTYLAFDTGAATRHLKLKVAGRTYTVDPNRMFDKRGLLAGGQAISPKPSAAVAERLAADARAFLKTVVVPELVKAKASALVALHNNHDGGAVSLAGLDGDATVAQLHRATHGGDHDDFVLTPDQLLFDHVRHADTVHAVRERQGLAEGDEADGSLSQYWQGANAKVGGRVVPYVNSEAQHEHTSAQRRQLELVQTFAGTSAFAQPQGQGSQATPSASTQAPARPTESSASSQRPAAAALPN